LRRLFLALGSALVVVAEFGANVERAVDEAHVAAVVLRIVQIGDEAAGGIEEHLRRVIDFFDERPVFGDLEARGAAEAVRPDFLTDFEVRPGERPF